jgi:glycosyltransferase involved in cell wall biosynthesis
MINKTLVSVVIPVYNMEDYLEETVNSVLQSTYPNIEIILMDDGSSDKSPLIGKKLSEQHPSIFFYSQTNKGVAAARNMPYRLPRVNISFLWIRRHLS